MLNSDVEVRVVEPDASSVQVVIPATGARSALVRSDDEWVGTVPEGTVYGLVADGGGPRFDTTKVLLDARATEVVFALTHDRELAGTPGAEHVGPLAVARHPRPRRSGRRSGRPPVVYEAHVRGLTRCRGGPSAGTYASLVEELPRLAALGVTVIELMPVHQQDPRAGSYWGYMPLAFGAVERR